MLHQSNGNLDSLAFRPRQHPRSNPHQTLPRSQLTLQSKPRICRLRPRSLPAQHPLQHSIQEPLSMQGLQMNAILLTAMPGVPAVQC